LEWLTQGIQVTIVGMGIVFALLYALQLTLGILGRILGSKGSSQEKKTTYDAISVDEDVTSTETPSSSVQTLNFNTVVAISAALAAMMGSRSVSVVSIRRDSAPVSAWQQSTHMDNVEVTRH